MRELYHYPLCAYGRLVRVYLKEKALDHDTIVELPWDRKHPFSNNHVLSDLPTLIDIDGTVLESWYSIIEHMEQSYRANSLLGVTHKEKAETRRIMMLFNTMFYSDVTKNIVFEKVIKRYIDHSSPDSSRIRNGNMAIAKYMEYIKYLTDMRNWLAGENFTCADISAATQLSCIDYIGAIEWDKFPEVKDWYVRIKSRPSFRDILQDKVPSLTPPSYYALLDF